MNRGVGWPRGVGAGVYALAGAVALAVYSLSSSDVVAAAVMVGAYLSALVAVVLGVRRNRPPDRVPWLLLAAALTIWVVAWALWETRIVETGAPPGPSSLVNVLFLVGYPTLLAALVLLISRREPDAVALIDTAIVAAALFVPIWVVVISGYVDDETLSPFARAVQVSYGVFDVLLLAVALRLFVSTGPRTPAFYALVASPALFVLSDVVWNWSTRLRSYTPGSWADAGWLLLPVLVSAAVLSPSMRSLYDRIPRADRRLRPGRFLVLAVASVVAPALLVSEALRGDAELHETIVIGLAALLVALLVLGELALLFRDQGRLADALARRSEWLRELAQTVEATDDAVVAMTPDGVVTAWNPGAVRLFGYSADEMVGASVFRLVPEGQTTDQAERLARVRCGGPPETYDAVRRAKDGRLVDISVTLSPVCDDEGNVVALAAIARDISDRKRLEAERERLLTAERRAREEAEAARAEVAVQYGRLREAEALAHVGHWERDFLASRTSWSDEFFRILGLDPAADRASFGRFVDAVAPEDREPLETALARTLKAAAPLDAEFRLVRPDGEVRVVHGRGELERTEDGTPARMFGTIQDVTAAKELEAERERLLAAEREQNERLRQLDTLKDEFVSLVSHELRTPLTSIRGYLELVLDGEAGALTEGQRRFLDVVNRNTDRLLHLVSDLLFLAQVDAGRLSLEPRPVDLAGLAADSVEAARPAAEARGIELELVTEPELEVVADAARVAQVLDNLVSNAIKFTPAGGTVRLRVLQVDGYARAEVSDTGIGIPREEQEHLFERFFRSSLAAEHAVHGTGLGLAIAKAIVDAHGGRIRFESGAGAGTTFFVDLPVEQPAPAPRREPAAVEAAAIRDAN